MRRHGHDTPPGRTSRTPTHTLTRTLTRALLSPPGRADHRTLRSVVAGRTVLITGASSGIGEAAAWLFARAGAEVLLLARTEPKLQTICARIRAEGGRAHVYAVDLTRPEAVGSVVETLLARHARIDVVISNAGKSIRRSALAGAERRDLERSLAVNFTGPAALLLGLLPRLAAQGGGQIVNVSTVSVTPPAAPRWASYQASKTGFDVWLRSAALEVRSSGVRTSSVYLPLVRTPMSAASGLYDRVPALTAEEAAQVVAGAVVRPRSRIAPWWLRAQEIVAVLLPGALDAVLLRVENAEQRRERGRP